MTSSEEKYHASLHLSKQENGKDQFYMWKKISWDHIKPQTAYNNMFGIC